MTRKSATLVIKSFTESIMMAEACAGPNPTLPPNHIHIEPSFASIARWCCRPGRHLYADLAPLQAVLAWAGAPAYPSAAADPSYAAAAAAVAVAVAAAEGLPWVAAHTLAEPHTAAVPPPAAVAAAAAGAVAGGSGPPQDHGEIAAVDSFREAVPAVDTPQGVDPHLYAPWGLVAPPAAEEGTVAGFAGTGVTAAAPGLPDGAVAGRGNPPSWLGLGPSLAGSELGRGPSSAVGSEP